MRRLHSVIPRFAIGYFLLFVNFAVVTPYLQVFLNLQGYGTILIGLLLGIFQMAGVAGPLLIGHLADRRSWYRPLLALSLVLCFAALIPLKLIFNPWIAAVILAVFGLFFQSLVPLTDAIVTRNLADPATQYGRARVFGSIGFVAMSLFIQASGILSRPTTQTILVASLATGGAFLIGMPLYPSTRSERTAPRLFENRSVAGAIDPLFWVGIAAIFLGRFGITAHYSFFSLFLQQRLHIESISGLWAIGSIAEIPVILFGGTLLKRFRTEGLLALSLLAISIRIFGYSLLPSLPVLIALQFLHALTFGGLHMSAINLVNTYTSPSRRAMGMAIYAAVGNGIPAFIASALGGIVLQRWGFPTMFGLYSIFPLVGVALMPILHYRSTRRPAAGSQEKL